MAKTTDVVCLDTDTLSAIARGHERANERARSYLARHHRFTFTSVTVAERLRGYYAALRTGKPFVAQLAEFERVVASSAILPLDAVAASIAGRIAAALRRRSFGCDLLIVAIAAAHRMPIVTRNKADFAPLVALPFVGLPVLDWTA